MIYYRWLEDETSLVHIYLLFLDRYWLLFDKRVDSLNAYEADGVKMIIIAILLM